MNGNCHVWKAKSKKQCLQCLFIDKRQFSSTELPEYSFVLAEYRFLLVKMVFSFAE